MQADSHATTLVDTGRHAWHDARVYVVEDVSTVVLNVHNTPAFIRLHLGRILNEEEMTRLVSANVLSPIHVKVQVGDWDVNTCRFNNSELRLPANNKRQNAVPMMQPTYYKRKRVQ
jgi:hypothetical protein